MQPSHWGRYIKERLNMNIIEDDSGFVTYHFTAGCCYIVDIYVVPEKRRSRVAWDYLDRLAEEAKDCGIKVLIGQVNPAAEGATASVKAHLAYGFELETCNQGILFFKKVLEV